MSDEYREDLLDLAMGCGAVMTGKPNGSEAITIVFSVDAWRAFDLANTLPQDKVVIDRKDLLVTVANHGGYIEARCVACGAAGWDQTLEHKPDCPSLVQPVRRVRRRGPLDEVDVELLAAIDKMKPPPPITDEDVRALQDRVSSGQAEENEVLHFLQRLVPPRPVGVAGVLDGVEFTLERKTLFLDFPTAEAASDFHARMVKEAKQ